MQKAVALAYDVKQDNAPRVLASGKGTIAEKIIAKAKEYDVPLFANDELVDMLLQVEIESEIPAELYEVVVRVFVWLNRLESNAQLSRT